MEADIGPYSNNAKIHGSNTIEIRKKLSNLALMSWAGRRIYVRKINDQ